MEKISGLGSIYYHSSKQRWVAQYTEDKNGVKKQKYIYGKTKDEVNRKNKEKQYNYHNDNYNHFEPPFFIRCPRPALLRFSSV